MDDVAGAHTDCDVAQELREVRGELALLRALLEERAASSGGTAPAALARDRAPAWHDRVRETEERLLLESISRQRRYTRNVLRQEELSAVDLDAAPEVQQTASAATENLRRALTALEDVRTAEELATWRETFSIEPIE